MFLENLDYCDRLRELNIFTLDSVYDRLLHKRYYDYNLKIFDTNYIDFLLALSDQNENIAQWVYDYRASGEISPVTTPQLLDCITKEDLQDENVRLVIGVHLLLANSRAQTYPKNTPTNAQER